MGGRPNERRRAGFEELQRVKHDWMENCGGRNFRQDEMGCEG